MPQRPESSAVQIEALREIERQAERLIRLARADNLGMVGFLLKNVLHEARSELAERGQPGVGESAPDNVVVLRFDPDGDDTR